MYSDNQNVESILRDGSKLEIRRYYYFFFYFFDYRDKGRGHGRRLDGSRKCDLQDLALVVLQICSHHCISPEVKWIPRDLNASADCIGKLVDFDG